MRTGPDTECFVDCVTAATILGGLHPKTVGRWARQGRIPAYRYFKHCCDEETAEVPERENQSAERAQKKCTPRQKQGCLTYKFPYFA